METLVVIIRAFLAAVFVIAAVSKLRDLEGTRKSVVSFGVPESIASAFSIALPLVEIVATAMLLMVATSWFGAIAVTALLVGFTIVITVQLAKGAEPDCHCFGQLSAEKIGISSIFRNAMFLAPAAFLVARGSGGQGTEIWLLDAQSVLILMASAGIGLLIVALGLLQRVLNNQSELAKRLDLLELAAPIAEVEREHAGHPHDGLPIGALLPEFELKDTDGESISTISLYANGKGALLLFVSPTCAPCKNLVPKFREWAAELSEKVNLYLITSGKADENIKKFGDLPSSPLLLQEKREFADAVNAKWTPSAIYINSKGRVASHISAGDTAVAELVEKVRAADLSDDTTRFELPNANGGFNRIEIGSEIPEFSLKTIDGNQFSKETLRGTETLVTFWSTTCPHCKAMEPELKRWAAGRNGDSPRLVMLSTGQIDEHKALEIEAPIAIDEGNAVSETLGMFGTPSAVLIDEKGRFASEIAIGAPNIWLLVGNRSK